MLRSSRRGITFIEVVVTLGVLGFLFILFLIWVEGPGGGAREAARRNHCTNKLKQIGLGLQNFANARKHFPGSSSKKFTTFPASLPTNEAGYSWQTMILPYIEEENLYKRLDLEKNPWAVGDPAVYKNPNDPDHIEETCHPLVWHTVVDTFLCPDRDIDTDLVITPGPYNSDDLPCHALPAATSYVALSATHVESLLYNDDDALSAGGHQHPNGVMYPGSKTSFRNIRDGSSNTAIVCETKEPRYCAWFEATTAGVVGLMPKTVGETITYEPTNPDANYMYPSNARTTLNQTGYGKLIGLPGWKYGPSSDHPGFVLHLFGDGSVHSIHQNIDRKTYSSIITRDGGEPVWLDD
ncbi:MAG: DUF1559 domain-containing protein [Planctomycetia bacterium]|jgi:hypothetical protein